MPTKIAMFSVVMSLILVTCLAVACGGGAEPTRSVPTALATGTTASAPTAGTTTSAPSATPALDGETLLNARCVACHPLDRVTQARYTLVQWESTVKRMRANGASLTDAEAQVLVQYLAQTYGK